MRRLWPGDLAPVGAVAGAIAWGGAGLWRALHEVHHPWNQTNPIPYGASNGVVFGAFAALVGAVFAGRFGRGPRGTAAAVFAGAVLGGALLAAARNLIGAPAPGRSPAGPGAGGWYASPAVQQWTVQTVLPAIACAGLLALAVWALTTRLSRLRGLTVWSGLLWVALGLAMLVLPGLVAYDGPVEGNGAHTNEPVIAAMTAWLTGTAVVVVGSVRVFRGSRGATSAAG